MSEPSKDTFLRHLRRYETFFSFAISRYDTLGVKTSITSGCIASFITENFYCPPFP
jgi:hypothetical protein